MAGSSQPQHFFAAGCIFADFVIALIFYPIKETLWKILCILFGCCNIQILNLRAKINISKNLKIVRKFGSNPNFRRRDVIAKRWVWYWPSDSARALHHKTPNCWTLLSKGHITLILYTKGSVNAPYLLIKCMEVFILSLLLFSLSLLFSTKVELTPSHCP